jgi:hypothetical protein
VREESSAPYDDQVRAVGAGPSTPNKGSW